MMPLSFDWAALNSKVDEMTPNGNTNVTIGLVWAWHALTTQAPLPPPPTTPKSPASHHHTRTQLVCSNIKAANIKLYTSRRQWRQHAVEELRDEPEHVLRRPAASQLNDAFAAIAPHHRRQWLARANHFSFKTYAGFTRSVYETATR